MNPHAGKKAVARGWPAAQAVLEEAGLAFTVAQTERPGHATALTRDAIRSGARYIVAVGGDGTVNEVVNGMMGHDKALNPEAVLGVIAAGSGCDFVRTFGLPQDPARAAKHLLGENLWGSIDVGRVDYLDRDGNPATRWFANIAEVGLGAAVVASAERMPRWLGGSVYKLAAIREISRHEPYPVTLRMHGRKARGVAVDTPLTDMSMTVDLTLLVVANCQFYGGGMKVAPRAIPGDGMLDVQVAAGSKVDALKVMQKISKGTHLPNPKIAEYLATSLTIESEQPVWIEADGEVLGTTPATFQVRADAIPLKV